MQNFGIKKIGNISILTFMAMTTCLSSCQKDERTELIVQRFFGACEAKYGKTIDPAQAEGECGIIASMINGFEAQNPDIKVVENIVFWPGYDQLTAQLAANDAPHLVTMHGSVLSDYQARDLIKPMDDVLSRAGVDANGFTDATKLAVSIEDKIYGLPIDTWSNLWHINLNLFAKAGLVRDGKPILPTNPTELFAQAEQFKARTGLPYFVQADANEYAGHTRNFYTLMQQQGANFYQKTPTQDGKSDESKAVFKTEQGRAAINVFKTIYDRDLTTKNQDYSAAVSGFLRGDGGVFLVGTWMVGAFDSASKDESKALYPRGADGAKTSAHGGYAVVPFPQLFAHNKVYADGHNWVMPKTKKLSAAQEEAVEKFLKYFAEQNHHWARTGHMPSMTSVIEDADWQALPHRNALSSLAKSATPLPKYIRRQFPLETIVGQEAGAAISGIKPVDQALSDMERRVQDVLDHY